ncbi:MAG: hypothetical protein WB615_03860 [Candidatus Tumulicola sp.]
MKWTLAAPAALVAVVSLAAAARWGTAPVAAATPTPAALQYDEISRPLVPPNTPPPPGAFAADYQAAATAQTPKPHGFNPFTAIHDAQQMMQAVNAGRVTRFAFYNGWIRRDDVNAQTATIEKCDRHQYIKLDLAKRTYSTTTAAPPCPTPTQYSGAPPSQGETGGSGSIDITVNATTTNLGPLTIDGLETSGVDRAIELKMSNATGSCRGNMNGVDVIMNAREYVSQVAVPRRFCPLPQSTSMTDMFARYGMGNGCKPKFHSEQGGDAGAVLSDLESGKTLALYSSSTLGMPNAPKQAGGFGMVVERGNVKWLSGAEAQALFEIPAGFTQN